MKSAAIVYLFALGISLASSLGRASIEGSKHDFRTPGSESAASGTSKEICAFCHTPVGGETVADGPLWNPQTNEGTFERFASFPTSNLEENSELVGPVSLTCLSCHDGTQARDVSYIGLTPHNGEVTQQLGADATARDASLSIPSLTTLSHPVGVSYANGACAGIEMDCDPGTVAGGSREFNMARFDVINETKSWWVDTAKGVPGMRDKSDIILYARDFDGTVGPAVECGSCHDPHEGQQQPVSFLRLPAADSALCLACHVK